MVGSLARLHLAPLKFDRRPIPSSLSRAAAASIFSTRRATPGPPTTSRSRASLTLTCAAISLPKPGRKSSTSASSISAATRGQDALQFLMTREITHMKAFAAALEKPAFTIGKIAPTPGLVNQFFNDSTGSGDHGEIDTRGPWNEGAGWEFGQSPALSSPTADGNAPIAVEARRQWRPRAFRIFSLMSSGIFSTRRSS